MWYLQLCISVHYYVWPIFYALWSWGSNCYMYIWYTTSCIKHACITFQPCILLAIDHSWKKLWTLIIHWMHCLKLTSVSYKDFHSDQSQSHPLLRQNSRRSNAVVSLSFSLSHSLSLSLSLCLCLSRMHVHLPAMCHPHN